MDEINQKSDISGVLFYDVLFSKILRFATHLLFTAISYTYDVIVVAELIS